MQSLLLESNPNEKGMNKIINNIVYDSTSNSIFISSFNSLETYIHRLPKQDELVKDYDSEGEVRPFGIYMQNDSEELILSSSIKAMMLLLILLLHLILCAK